MKTQFKLSLLGTSLLVGAATLATPAFAQDQEQDTSATSDSTIVVTGTLISNPNIQRAAPVNVTSADEIDLLQSNVAEEILREIPGIVPSIGSAVNNGNGGNSFVNLRGLGSNRNVVLLDGARVVPSDLVGRFDLNNIPLALVERVEVLTGGSSTTYGADAIAGVVNFITRQDFAGLEVNAATQINERGDGNTIRLDLTTGANFDDGRGNVVLGIGYQQSDQVLQGDRQIGLNTIGSANGLGAGSGTAVPSRFNLGSGQRQIAPDGQSLIANYSSFNFNPFNIFQTPFERFNIFAQGKYEISDSVEVYTRGLFSKNTVDTLIAPSGAFGISVQIPLSNPFLPAGIRNQFCAQTDTNTTLTGIQPITTAQCNAAALATNPNDPNFRQITATLNRRTVELGSRTSEFQNTVFDYKLGVRGSITDTIDYDVFGSYGEADQVQTIAGYALNSRVRQSLLSTNPNTCLNTANNCVPANFFTGGAAISPEAAAFLSGQSTTITQTTLAQARATVSGDFGVTSPFAEEPISFAVGGEYRKYGANQFADELARTGDLGGAGGAVPSVNGGYDVYEAIGEIIIPVVQGKPFFEDLTIEGGIRYSDYTVDSPLSPGYQTTTWKAGGSWTPVEGLKVRGFYARAVRAPNISELFAPVNTGLTSLNRDPCASIDDSNNRISAGPTGVVRDICLAQGATLNNINNINVPIASQANATSGGNLALDAETSNSYTIGVVLQPAFIPGFSMTVDYYNIEVSGAITTPTAGDALDACFVNNPSPTSAACQAIGRDPVSGGLNGDPATTTGLFVGLSNLGALATDGIDVSMNYRRDLGFADLALAVNGNWTNKSTFQATPTSVNRDCVGLFSPDCGSLQPEFQFTTRATLGFDGVDVSLLWRYIDAFTYENADTAPFFRGTPVGFTTVEDFNRIDAYNYFDLTTRFDLMENLTVTLLVQNLFDKAPPVVGSDAGPTAFNSGNTFPSTYDTLGRRFGAAVKLRF